MYRGWSNTVPAGLIHTWGFEAELHMHLLLPMLLMDMGMFYSVLSFPICSVCCNSRLRAVLLFDCRKVPRFRMGMRYSPYYWMPSSAEMDLLILLDGWTKHPTPSYGMLSWPDVSAIYEGIVRPPNLHWGGWFCEDWTHLTANLVNLRCFLLLVLIYIQMFFVKISIVKMVNIWGFHLPIHPPPPQKKNTQYAIDSSLC